MSCDVGEVTERLENEQSSFRHFTYVTAHSPTLPSLYLRYSSFYNPSVASHTSQFILQPFFRFSYVTSSSLNSPGEPPISRRQIPQADEQWYSMRTNVSIGNFTVIEEILEKSKRRDQLNRDTNPDHSNKKENISTRTVYGNIFHIFTRLKKVTL